MLSFVKNLHASKNAMKYPSNLRGLYSKVSNMNSAKARKVFISYSHSDSSWLDRLQMHLKPLERAGLIDRWDDTCILAGKVRTELVQAALHEAQIAVILVSASFLASEQLTTEELPHLLDAAARGQLTVLPLIVSPCLIDSEPRLALLRPVNSMERALITLSLGDQEEVLKRVAQVIMTTLYATDGELASTSRQEPTGLQLQNLDDISCRLLAGEMMKQVIKLVGSSAPRLQVGLPHGLRLDVLLNVASIHNHTLLQTLRHHLEMIGILEERISFLRRQQQMPIGQVVDFSTELRDKEAQRDDEIRCVRDALGAFVDKLTLFP